MNFIRKFKGGIDMRLKGKFRRKLITIGSWITIGDYSVAEIMAKAGFDWLAVDMEHSAIEISQAQELVRIIELCGCTPLIRVGRNDPYLIKRAMDVGSHGVIVPMVNNKEEAIMAVGAVKYPPVGTRGVGLGRAQGYGLDFERYKKWVNKNSIVIVQIEHIDAVDNIESILEVDGVDGFILGPYDLSASMGRPGEFTHVTVKAAIDKVANISKNINKAAGIHVTEPDYNEVNKRIEQGYKFIAFSLDTLFLGKSCINGISKIKRTVKYRERHSKK